MKLCIGDCLEIMKSMPDQSVDLVFCSPPYEAARTYGIDFNLRGQDWVDWCFVRFVECVRICRGTVAWVVEGQTRNYRYSATPLLLAADLHRAGINLRKPPIFNRIGIPGSGGPDWVRNDYEFILCATPAGRLPWSDNTAMGHPPKWAPGGQMSNRHADGRRINAQLSKRIEPKADDEATRALGYMPPNKANPGNVFKAIVGGGVMGSKLCHENEAPFPESLAEAFIRTFCPLGGIVLDPFVGSGTTVAVAKRLGRDGIGIDIRDSQIEICQRRLSQVQREMSQCEG